MTPVNFLFLWPACCVPIIMTSSRSGWGLWRLLTAAATHTEPVRATDAHHSPLVGASPLGTGAIQHV